MRDDDGSGVVESGGVDNTGVIDNAGGHRVDVERGTEGAEETRARKKQGRRG